MSLKGLWMPPVTARLLSRTRLLRRRDRAERARLLGRKPHTVHYFHQVDDPYSGLLASALPALASRYDIELVSHVVGPPSDVVAPEREMLIAHSRRDGALLAEHFGLAYRDPGAQPEPGAVRTATALLVQAVADGRFVAVAGPISQGLWDGALPLQDPSPPGGPLREAEASQVAAHLDASERLRARLGHYLGATLFYGREWYWGIDRLYHLEQRLQDLGAQRGAVQTPLFPPPPDVPAAVPYAAQRSVDFFFSLRSPYSAIVMPRVFELARATGAVVRLRFVLPMVMRGLPVPRTKRMYLAEDAAREAFARGIPFGRICDPLGVPTERGLSLISFAERAGRAEAYLLSFMRGVWAEGIDAGSDRGLRRIVERAGLPWTDARRALQDDAWRQTAEDNRLEMFRLGVWGVPSFRVGDRVVWGQDRLWAVAAALRAG